MVSGPTAKPRVALTFHTNGDLDLADQLLDVLDARHVKMTSFIVGDWLEANPDMAKRIAEGGHEFANHTYTHPSFLDLDRDAQLVEIVHCRDVLERLTGGPGAAFRPSGTDDGTVSPGEQVLSVAAEAGYTTVLGFDVDPFDYDDPGRGGGDATDAGGGEPRLDREPALRTPGHGGSAPRHPRRPRAAQPHPGDRLDPVGLTSFGPQRPKWFIKSNNLGGSRPRRTPWNAP